MFKAGEKYRITRTDPSDLGSVYYDHGTVVEFQFPLLKLSHEGKETIFNMTAPQIISAEKQKF